MIIGYDAKRAFKNRTGLGNYSRMIIGGVAGACPDIQGLLYTHSSDGLFSNYFDSHHNIKVIQPRALARLFPHLWRSYGIAARLNSDGVHIFHGLSHELPHLIPKQVKTVVTMHDMIVWRYPQLFKPADRIIYRTKMRHSCHIADIVVAASQQTKNDLIDILAVQPEKIRVVYQSCDPIFWQPATNHDKAEVQQRYNLPHTYAICVGTIERRKNQHSVVQALASLPKDLHLVLVGGHHSDYYKTLLQTIKNTGVEDRVHILSNARFADFPALYANAMMSVYVSEFEGFGIPILESMCCNTPVVASNTSSMPEVGGNAALYATPTQVDQIAEKMLALYNNEQLRRQLAEKGLLQKQNFTPQAISLQMMKIYNELAK